MMNYEIIKTNMCMVLDQKNRMLVIDRVKSDWPGLTLPGGHLEDGETLIDSVIREVLEETGLTIAAPNYKGYIIWVNDDKKTCEIAYLFLSKSFEGNLVSSSEGSAFFISIDEYKKWKLSTDFEMIVEKILSD